MARDARTNEANSKGSKSAPRPKKSTTDRILDAAEERFAKRGYDATSLNDIADDVGIRTPSVYKHFDSKRSVYVAVVERLLAPYFELLDRLLVVPAAAEDGQRNLVAVLDHYMRTPNLARLVQHATLAEGEELDVLVERWYAPLFARAAELTNPAGSASRERGQAIAVVVGFHAMMSGYMTMAPLHARLMNVDPYGPGAIATQLGLMQRLALELWDSGASAASAVTRASTPEPSPAAPRSTTERKPRNA